MTKKTMECFVEVLKMVEWNKAEAKCKVFVRGGASDENLRRHLNLPRTCRHRAQTHLRPALPPLGNHAPLRNADSRFHKRDAQYGNPD